MVSVASASSESGRSRRSAADSGFRSQSAGFPTTDEIEIVPTQCHCGYSIHVLTSMTAKNPGRRFYRCPIRSEDDAGCGIWKWVDPALSNHYKTMMNDLLATRDRLLNERAALLRAVMAKDAEIGNLKEECIGRGHPVGGGHLRHASIAVDDHILPAANHHQKMMYILPFGALLLAAIVMIMLK